MKVKIISNTEDEIHRLHFYPCKMMGVTLLVRKLCYNIRMVVEFDRRNIPQVGLSEAGGVIPPKTAVGTGVDEPSEPSETTGAAIFWSLYNRAPEELPELNEFLEKYNFLPTDSANKNHQKGLKRFIRDAKQRGLIKPPKALNLRQYVGALVY
ncbi:MAG: hypothetical protein ABIC96_01985 [Patescibacteria group bacterium]